MTFTLLPSAISIVLSSEGPTTTMISSGVKAWPRREANRIGSDFSSLRAGIITDTEVQKLVSLLLLLQRWILNKKRKPKNQNAV
jgi:hypothetical protein